ncbi:MAG: DUF4032 domain-containing protein, partial [Ignavibacteriales bacterium]|nr:DUF4032 domain-containing protein [Ignavibacteriales bacterium]
MSNRRIRYHVDPLFRAEVEKLPWHLPIAEWQDNGITTLAIKRGTSRHTVIFVRAGRFSFGIKEISEVISKKEIHRYEQLLLRGIHTLVPVGYVVREEPPIVVQTPIGPQFEENNYSHTITLLVERVIPDSELYRRAFSFANRKRIWDAIAALFVELHINGVYWGDASLANTLVRFDKETVPQIGKTTVLQAYLADAETVEIQPEVSPALREADLTFFFESMQWINEDLRSSGIMRDDLASEEDGSYLRQQYERLMAVEDRKREFEIDTSFSIDKYLGRIPDPSYVDLFLKHIEEHKWYLSEHAQKPLTLKEATADWYSAVFVPTCRILRAEGMLDFFPGKTAAELYIEIMTNKYFLSEKRGEDVGMIQAMNDYAERFGTNDPSPSVLGAFVLKMRSVFGWK